MKWQILLEVQLYGDPDEIEALLDEVMECLVDSGIDDPTVGAALATGVAQIEFVVEAASLQEAQVLARELCVKALGQPNGEFIGESTRRSLVPA